MGDALTQEDIKKVHDYEDAWISLVEHTKIKVVEATLFMRDYFSEMAKGTSPMTDKATAPHSRGRRQIRNVSTVCPENGSIRPNSSRNSRKWRRSWPG